MTTISSTRMAPMQPALSLLQSGLGSSAAGADAGGLLGHGPATKLSLSDDAKSIMARARAEQKVADQLRSYLDASQGKSRGQAKSVSPTDGMEVSEQALGMSSNKLDRGADIMVKYNHLNGAKEWAAQSRADNIGMMKKAVESMDFDAKVSEQRRLSAGEALKRKGVPTPDEQWLEGTQDMIAQKYVELFDSGRKDQAQALRQAVQNGTINFQRAEDVPSLGARHQVEHSSDAGTYGGTSVSFTTAATGKTKDAISAGRALAFSGSDRGAFYMSW